jgi:hypothetical protein
MAPHYPDDAYLDAKVDAYLGELKNAGIDPDDFDDYLNESGLRYCYRMSLPELIEDYLHDRPQNA